MAEFAGDELVCAWCADEYGCCVSLDPEERSTAYDGLGHVLWMCGDVRVGVLTVTALGWLRCARP